MENIFLAVQQKYLNMQAAAICKKLSVKFYQLAGVRKLENEKLLREFHPVIFVRKG